MGRVASEEQASMNRRPSAICSWVGRDSKFCLRCCLIRRVTLIAAFFTALA